MNAHDIQPLLQWVNAHPGWAGVLVFVIAFTESLLVVGLVVPGVVLLFGLGTLVGSGHLPFWPTVSWAAAGAFMGDLVSFLLGYRYHEQLRERWPLKNFPRLYEKGHTFFARHGGKSVVLGRFVGAVRPIIPAVAGMAGMTVRRFLIIDALSALAWAPAYLFPGIIVGASLGVAAQVTSRLATLLAALIVALWLVYASVRWLARLLQPACDRAMAYTLAWAQRHRKVGPFAESLLAEQAAELPGVLAFGLLLAGLGWAGFRIALTLRGEQTAGFINNSVYHLLLQVHTPWVEPAARAFARWTDWPVWTAVGLVCSALLWLQRRRRAAMHILAALAFGGVLDLGLLPLISVPTAASAQLPTSAVPPASVVGAVAVYGLIAGLLASRLDAARRWPVYTATALTLSISVFARLYLGTLWLGTAGGSLVLGLAWTVVLTAGYRSHKEAGPVPVSVAGILGLILAITLLSPPAWIARRDIRPDAARAVHDISEGRWWNNRGDSGIPPPLPTGHAAQSAVEYVGDPAVLVAALQKTGWRRPPRLDYRSSLRWFSKTEQIAHLPLLPAYRQGRAQAIQLTYPFPDPRREWVLRLWESDWRVDGRPLYRGTVSRHDISGRIFLLSLPLHVHKSDSDPITAVTRGLGSSSWKIAHAGKHPVLLIHLAP